MRRKHIRNLLLLFVLHKRFLILFFIQKYEETINEALFIQNHRSEPKLLMSNSIAKKISFSKNYMAISPIILIAYNVQYLEIINLWANESIFWLYTFLESKIGNKFLYVLSMPDSIMQKIQNYEIRRKFPSGHA